MDIVNICRWTFSGFEAEAAYRSRDRGRSNVAVRLGDYFGWLRDGGTGLIGATFRRRLVTIGQSLVRARQLNRSLMITIRAGGQEARHA